MKSRPRTFRTGDKRWTEVGEAARRRGISRSDFINEAVVAYLATDAERARAAAAVAALDERTLRELAELRERVADLEDLTGARRR